MSGVESFAKVKIEAMAVWIAAIPFTDWPQQSPELRPAMVTDLNWHGFGIMSWPVIHALGFDESQAYNLMLSVVMPKHSIPQHRDEQGKDWLFRVHVPLLSNAEAIFTSGGKDYVLRPGIAYKVDTRQEHSVINLGATPRVHFMFDCRGDNSNET